MAESPSGPITGPSRQATAEIVARFAVTGRDDPTIAARLGITAAQVRGLRQEFGIQPGETRWQPNAGPGGRAVAALAARIPALTVRNPWAWSAVTPPPERRKPVENRGRYMAHRGPLWWHAGARSRWDPAGADSPLVQTAWSEYVRALPGWPGLPASDITLGRKTTLMPFGAVTALVEVTGCHWWEECQSVGIFAPDGTMCCPWAARSQFHITLANVRPLPEPIPCRGALGLWRLPEDVEAQARKQLEAVPHG